MTPVDIDGHSASPDIAAEVAPADGSRRSGPLWYLREAVGIARFDHRAIERTSQDSWALLYGAGVLAVAFLIPPLVLAVATRLGVTEPAATDVGGPPLIAFALVTLPLYLVFSAGSIAVIHGAGRLLFGASGHYVAVLRVLWLGSIVQWLSIIPFLGALVGSVWYLLITLVAFEEVDRVERLQALVLVGLFGIIMFVLTGLVQ